jgi:hypothetical protein
MRGNVRFPGRTALTPTADAQELLCVGKCLFRFIYMAHRIFRFGEPEPGSSAIGLCRNSTLRVSQSLLPVSELCLAAAQEDQCQGRVVPDM